MTVALVTIATAALVSCVPAGLRLVETDDRAALCHYDVNCYNAEERAIVVSPGSSLQVIAHEACHAHQHQTVLTETGREPTLDLREWADTREARSYDVPPLAYSYHEGGDSKLEDFAEACAQYLTGYPAQDPARQTWFAEVWP